MNVMERERTPLREGHSPGSQQPPLKIFSSQFPSLFHWEKETEIRGWWEEMAEVVSHQVPGLFQERNTPLHSLQLGQSPALSCEGVGNGRWWKESTRIIMVFIRKGVRRGGRRGEGRYEGRGREGNMGKGGEWSGRETKGGEEKEQTRNKLGKRGVVEKKEEKEEDTPL